MSIAHVTFHLCVNSNYHLGGSEMNAHTPETEIGSATGWPRMVQLADFLDSLADESERDGLPDNAKRLRGDAAWYRNRFSPKDLK